MGQQRGEPNEHPAAERAWLYFLTIQPMVAQDHSNLAAQGHSPAAPATPYAGMQTRAIKALSEQQISDLRAGRGMSMALPAELNGYPGPIHVLEHADVLALTADQLQRTQTMYEAMKAEAIPLGERLIGQEMQLDRAFANRSITNETLAQWTSAIAQTQAALRAAHLHYHLAQAELLTSDQLQQYAELRGYGPPVGITPLHQ
ncbi:MAG: hypothetical protein QOJ96_3011 [Alphaproteobacteria bacterium]|jgi:hypothetical protein|nr:hypothetical protein [Alphaproteobacteria bacterium]